MARLNEPPVAPQPSAESIDAVKRRFLRQNRELAKTNSQQSIRIRSLENDCSRLLAENLSLREQVLNLHAAAESRPALDHIDAVRTQLESKLQELSGLVAGLSQPRRSTHGDRRKSKALARRRNGEERQFGSGLGLQEVENAMLPTIAEDKYYPRLTIGADEILDGLHDPECSQSPDIGPPPVSRFEHEEPFDIDPVPEVQAGAEEPIPEEEPTLSINLETRKKRRESGPKLNARRESVFESLEETEEVMMKSSRIGSKRKFSVQEDEAKTQSNGDSFRFSRRTLASGSETEASNEHSRPSSPERPVLSAKPVNTDPVVSPKKQRASVQDKPEKPEKKAQPPSKPRGRTRLNITRNDAPTEIPTLPMFEPVLSTDIVLEGLPPKTPAVEAIFSPPSTEPSTQRPENKDTPPPGDLTSTDQMGQAGRPGRRARPQVSYKEPSLNTKMRRPDAKLVDAIVDRRASADPQAAPPTVIKSESSEGLSWKPVSAVAGRANDEEAEIGSPLRQKLDRKETSMDMKTSPRSIEVEERSTVSKAVSALINETSIANRKVSSTNPIRQPIADSSEDRLATKEEPLIKLDPQDALAVFEFTGSPPAEAPSNPRTRISELAKASRNARRHSALPGTATEGRRLETIEGPVPTVHRRTGSGSIKSSNASNLSKSTTTSTTTKAAVKRLPASGSNNDLKVKTETASSERDGEVRSKETMALRAERSASRRKSMLL
ncbi:hypothetical protein ACN47E_010090 [Coniothyrium glycines]